MFLNPIFADFPDVKLIIILHFRIIQVALSLIVKLSFYYNK